MKIAYCYYNEFLIEINGQVALTHAILTISGKRSFITHYSHGLGSLNASSLVRYAET